MSDKTFDHIIQQKLEGLRVEPSKEVWSGITGKLDNKPAKIKIPFMWLSAACVLLVTAISFWINTPANNSQNQGTASKTTLQIPEAELPIIPEEKLQVAKETAPMKAVIKEKRQVPDPITKVSEEKSPVNDTEIKTIQPMAVIVGDGRQTEPDPVVQTAAAAAIPSETEDPEDETVLRSKRKVKSLGDLINFVVAQVDGREDKIIEVSDKEREGIRITGINLGLLKIKNNEK